MANRRMLAVLLWAILLATGSACAEYQVYWGDVHGHTNISDGKGSLDDYFTHARAAAKLDFVIVTDHDFGNAAPWHMPKEKWTLTQDKADEYTVNGRFVAIAGYEWTSQSKYWTPVEPLFNGPPKYYNHKNVYFPSRVDYIFSAKNPTYISPDLLAEAVRKAGGLVHNAHPDTGAESRDQFDYSPSSYPVIANTEMGADEATYQGKVHDIGCERAVRAFLNSGGKTGFVKGTDTHEGKPSARTAVLATELTRPALFEALKRRRTYAVSNARILLSFKVNGHEMGEEIEITGKPRVTVAIGGTDTIGEVAIIRDGAIIHARSPNAAKAQFEYVDDSFGNNSYYYLRVTQVDKDEHGNPSQAWSSPVWVKQQQVDLYP